MTEKRTLPTVCHVLHSLHFGGAEVLARQFALGLQSQFRPVFACLDSLGPIGQTLREQGVEVHVLDRRPGVDFRCMWRLRNWFKRQQVQLIHAHQYTPFFYASLARMMTARLPVVFTEHGRHFPDIRSPRRVKANRYLLRRRDRVVAVGEQVRQALIDNEGLPAERIEVIYNGVDTAAFARCEATRAAVRAELRLGPADFAVMQVARLNALKDHATAIRAIALLHARCPSARLILVGDGELRGDLERLVAELHVGHCVEFLGTRSDVPRLLQAADALLLSSISEGIPLTLVEAMLTRVPVVATRVGGVPEVIEDGVTGLLAAACDAQGLSQRLHTLALDRELAAQLAQHGESRSRDRFAEQSMLVAYASLYDRLLNPDRVRGQRRETPSRRDVPNRQRDRAQVVAVEEPQ